MATPAEPSPAFVPSVFLTPRLRRQELTELFLAEKRYFLRVAGAVLRNPADVEDALHTAFCSAWNAVESFRGESSLKTWLTRIIHNTALTTLRRSLAQRTVFYEDDPECLHAFELRSISAVEDPERVASRGERIRMVHDHLHALPEETRIVFKLHFDDDCSIDTIARLRQKSRPSVVAHLQRGKAILRKRMLVSTRPRRRAGSVLVH